MDRSKYIVLETSEAMPETSGKPTQRSTGTIILTLPMSTNHQMLRLDIDGGHIIFLSDANNNHILGGHVASSPQAGLCLSPDETRMMSRWTRCKMVIHSVSEEDISWEFGQGGIPSQLI